MSDLRRRIANLSPEKRALLEERLISESARLSTRRAIPRREKVNHCELSFAQQRLWFFDRLEPESPLYNVPFGIRLAGELDTDALERALNEIVRRHEALRTTFPVENGQPVQAIAERLSLEMQIEDLAAFPDSEREAEAGRLAAAEAMRPFDLAAGPLVRATLLRIAADLHVLILNIHHIVSDGWSAGVIYSELSTLYQAYREGDESPLPELAVQYADFAAWQKEWLEGGVLDKQFAYWQGKLAGAPVLELSTDKPRPRVQTYNGDTYSFELERGLADSLKRLSRERGVTLFMTLMAAFRTLLHRYTGQTDITVGTPVANRTRVEIEDLIGFFVNTLALRTNLGGDPPFDELLKREQQTAFEAYENQDIPFERLLERLQPERNLSYSPLFQALLALQNAPRGTLELPGLTLDTFLIGTKTAKFDLMLMATEDHGALRCRMEYNTDLFERATIERMAGHFTRLLEGVSKNPSAQISTLPLLSDAERVRLTVEVNDTKVPYPRDGAVHQLFEEQAERTPEATALIFNDDRLTYRELNSRANRLARRLAKAGVTKGDLVGLFSHRSMEMIVAMIAILKAGGAYVPLDPSYPAERLAFMLEDTGVKLLVTDESLREELTSTNARVISLEADLAAVEGESDSNVDAGTSGEDPAYVIYTSGSTGRPKGAVVPHRGVSRLLFGTDYARMDETRTFLQLAPISFDASTWEIWGALLHGARLVIFPERVPSIAALGETLRRHGVTTLWLSASLFNTIIDQAPEILSGLDELLTGGEALSVPHVRRALETLSDTRLVNGYGPTESTTFTCCYRVPRTLDPGLRSIPIGRAIANTSVYILDGNLEPVPVGVPGELYIGGDGLALEYLNRPELTAERFIADPFAGSDDARLYRTGDLARRLNDGNIEFLGRTDFQVKIRGFRVELGEIEATLARHPSVREAVALCREDRPGEKRLVAYVVAEESTEPSADDLRRFLETKLPDYMVPTACVVLASLPLTPNGKVDRAALPAPDDSTRGDAFLAPRTPVEEALARIWAEALNMDEVGVRDDFFDLGGHSLLAVTVFMKIEKVFGRKLPLASLFQAPTIEKLAGLMGQEGGLDVFPPLVTIEEGDEGLPFFCVATADAFIYADLAERLGPGRAVYGLHPQGLVSIHRPVIDIHWLAGKYIEEMRKVRPTGPYLLGGLCAAGAVAYEVARQLTAAGEEVPLVALLDTPGPFHPIYRLLLALRSLRRFGKHMLTHARNLWRLRGSERMDYLRMRTGRLRRKLHGEEVCPDKPTDDVPVERAYWMAFNGAYMRSMAEYRPEPYAGKVVLFLASDEDAWRFSASRRNWRRLTHGRVEEHVIPGTHSEILHEPGVAPLAERLLEHIRRIESDDARGKA